MRRSCRSAVSARRRYSLANSPNRKKYASFPRTKIQPKKKRNAPCARRATYSKFPPQENILSAARIFQNAATLCTTSQFCKAPNNAPNVADFWSSEKARDIGLLAARTTHIARTRKKFRRSFFAKSHGQADGKQKQGLQHIVQCFLRVAVILKFVFNPNVGFGSQILACAVNAEQDSEKPVKVFVILFCYTPLRPVCPRTFA